jgi:hypothetical protein
MAPKRGFSTDRKESSFEGFSVDRIWYASVESDRAPVVAFEIERGVPTNERFHKDIFNLTATHAPLGFIVLPHFRILATAKNVLSAPKNQRELGLTWYRDHAGRCLEIYRRPLGFYMEIRILDADKLQETRSLDRARVSLRTT